MPRARKCAARECIDAPSFRGVNANPEPMHAVVLDPGSRAEFILGRAEGATRGRSAGMTKNLRGCAAPGMTTERTDELETRTEEQSETEIE
jgi:hypothetical protein